MTTNAGTGVKTTTVGFGADDVKGDEQLINGLKDYFKPEFLNRFDAIVQFNDLQKKDLVSIVDLMLEDVIESASEQGIRIEVMEEAKEKIVNIGYDPAFGARPLRRVIEEYVEDGIADLMLNTEDYSQLVVMMEDDRVVVKTK